MNYVLEVKTTAGTTETYEHEDMSWVDAAITLARSCPDYLSHTVSGTGQD